MRTGRPPTAVPASADEKVAIHLRIDARTYSELMQSSRELHLNRNATARKAFRLLRIALDAQANGEPVAIGGVNIRIL